MIKCSFKIRDTGEIPMESVRKWMKSFLTSLIVICLVTLVALLIFARGVLVSEDVAIKALETSGFENAVVTERDWFCIAWRGGSTDDVVRFQCTATNPSGKEVTVFVYAGWPFKGATVRTP
jgi:hypothetical protein